MTSLEAVIDLHLGQERLGPGSGEDTLRALQLTGLDTAKPLCIADIGCGTGAQTTVLAKNTTGSLTAIDLFPDFLARLESGLSEKNLQGRVQCVQASMDNLPFEKEAFDLIWSEGAIYNIGFRAGLEYWRQFLKSGGIIAVSEITWLTNSRPLEIEKFWAEAYPEIGTLDQKLQDLKSAGYEVKGHFFLSESSWIDNYYQPIAANFSAFLDRHKHSEMAIAVVREHEEEFELYRKFKNYYSYGFYIAQKL